MGRFRQRHDSSDEGEIDMSPLIDCVFILLIFFIVTTVFVDESGIKVEKPQARLRQGRRRQVRVLFIVRLTAKGDVVNVRQEQDIGINNIRSLVRKDSSAERCMKLRSSFRRIVNAPAGRLLCIRVVDEAKLGGAEEVSVAYGSTN